MYSYAKNQRLDILKMQFQEAYDRHMARLGQVEEQGRIALGALKKQYEDRLVSMQRDEDRLRRLHTDVMRNLKAQSDDLAVKLRAARDRENQASQSGGAS